METKPNQTPFINSIRALIKPSERQFDKIDEVSTMCEPNACTINCNLGSILNSPDTERDILF
jgi:hypothetical protein